MYHLPEGYQQRLDNDFFDDTPFTDEWQKEVYQLAREIANREHLRTILDLGCGSGYKLVTYLGEFTTIGVDLPPTVEFLRKKWPERTWLTSDLVTPLSADMVVCADVLEHMPDPDVMMRFIVQCAPRWIVLSTPERDTRQGPPLGPPYHAPHCREWNLTEFAAYVSDWFQIERGPYISGPFSGIHCPCTQTVLCRPRER